MIITPKGQGRSEVDLLDGRKPPDDPREPPNPADVEGRAKLARTYPRGKTRFPVGSHALAPVALPVLDALGRRLVEPDRTERAPWSLYSNPEAL